MASPVKRAKNKVQAAWPGAQVAERGKGYIKHAHPAEPGRFAYDCSVGGGYHFGAGPFSEDNEIDTAWIDADPVADAPWLKKMTLANYHAFFGPGNQEFDAGQIIRYVHPATGSDLTFQAQPIQWTNDLDQIATIADPQTIEPTALIDDRIVYAGAFGPGLDFEWIAGTNHLGKILTIQNAGAIGDPPAFIIAGGNPVIRLQFIFQKSAGVQIWIDGVLWSETPNDPRDSFELIEFRSAAGAGELLWAFRRPSAWDASDDPTDPAVSYRARRTGPNLFIDIRVPWSWLETAEYPIKIDPTVDESVGTGYDDAYEYGSGTFDNSASTVLLRSENSTTGSNYRCGGFRFQTVAVPNAATINAGTYCEAYVSGPADDPRLWFIGNDVDDAQDFNDEQDIIGRARTAATVAADEQGVGTGAYWGSSYDIATVIKEIVDRGGWASGQDIVILFIAQTTDPRRSCVFEAYDDPGGANNANLHIDYTEAAAAEGLAGERGIVRGARRGILRGV